MLARLERPFWINAMGTMNHWISAGRGAAAALLLAGGTLSASTVHAATPVDMELQLHSAPSSLSSERRSAWTCVLQRSIGSELVLGVSFGVMELGLRDGTGQGSISAALRLAHRLDFGTGPGVLPYVGLEGGGASALADTAGYGGVMAGVGWYPSDRSPFGFVAEWLGARKTISEGGVWVPDYSTTRYVNQLRIGLTQRY
jgi:hypothetical protein